MIRTSLPQGQSRIRIHRRAASAKRRTRSPSSGAPARPPLPVKGKAEPVAVFAANGIQHRRAIRLQEPVYALPMVGRQPELQQVEEKLAQALTGMGQVVGITGEAGMGKSRLIAEAIRLASRKGVDIYGGACQSDGWMP